MQHLISLLCSLYVLVNVMTTAESRNTTLIDPTVNTTERTVMTTAESRNTTLIDPTVNTTERTVMTTAESRNTTLKDPTVNTTESTGVATNNISTAEAVNLHPSKSIRISLSKEQSPIKQVSTSAYKTLSKKESVTQSGKQSAKQHNATLASPPIVQSSSGVAATGQLNVGTSTILTPKKDIIPSTHSPGKLSADQLFTPFVSSVVPMHTEQSVSATRKNMILSTVQPSFSFTSQITQSSVELSHVISSHYTSSSNIKVLSTLLPAPSSTHDVTSLIIQQSTTSSLVPLRKNLTSSTIIQSIRSSFGQLGLSSSPYINGSHKTPETSNNMTSFSMNQSTTSSTRPTNQSTLQFTNSSRSLTRSQLSATTDVLRPESSSPLIYPSIPQAKSHSSVTSSFGTSPTKDVHGSVAKSKDQTGLIVGVTVGITVILLMFVTILVCYRRKRASYQYNVFYDEQNIVMNPFDGPK